MSNIYIDLGVGDGDTILQFRNWRHLLPIAGEWMTYGFEPNPNMKKKWQRHTKDDTTIYQKAAWVEDGEIELSVSKPYYKTTVMKEKVDYDGGIKVTVPCFDFSRWLRQFRGSYVILKIDIEGAELPILTKMIADGTDDIPSFTFVEWHDGKMPTYKSNKYEILRDFRGNIKEWR